MLGLLLYYSIYDADSYYRCIHRKLIYPCIESCDICALLSKQSMQDQ